jgi:hypothetical protein
MPAFSILLHQAVGHFVVDGALADDGALLFTVQRGGIVLIIHNVKFGIIRLENLFCFSLVDLFQLLHFLFLLLLFIQFRL